MIRYLIGIVVMLAAFGPTLFGIHSLRRAVMPEWRGASAVLVESVAAVTAIVVVTELLGVFAVYNLPTVVAAHVAIGIGGVVLARRATDRAITVDLVDAPPRHTGRAGDVAAAIAVSVSIGPWITRTVVALTGGMPGADTTWYHLPAAAKLVQSGSLQHIEYFDGGALVPYYPLASTFFHASGMLFLDSDILSPFVNLGWAALLLLGTWLLGRPFGVSNVTLMAGAVLVSFPGFIGHNAGSAMNDVVTAALVVAALALLVNADHRRLTTSTPVIALAGSATGMALGTKWTAIPATGALTVAVLCLAVSGRRIRSGTTWLLASAATGLFTYVRNLIIVGNPIPPQRLGLGPIEFESVREEEGSSSIASWIGEGDAWDAVFRPGLDTWFGPLWPVVLACVVAGLALAIVRGPGVPVRIAAFTGLVALGGYLFMPQNLEIFGLPHYFLSNIRYSVAALGLGLVLLAIAAAPLRGRRAWLVPGVFLLLLATTTTAAGAWTGIGDWRFQDQVGREDTVAGIIIATLAGVAGVMATLRPEVVAARARVTASLLVGGALVASVALFDTYADARYADPPFSSDAVGLSDARIALHGLNAQFMYYGRDLDNHVQYVGRVTDGVIHPPASCAEWATLVNEGDYTHIVSGPFGKDVPGPFKWSYEDPATTLLQDIDATINLFGDPGDEVSSGNIVGLLRIDGPLDPTRCAQ